MAREHKVGVRLNDAEYWYLRRLAMTSGQDATQIMREALHEYVIARDSGAAIHLLRGTSPGRPARPRST